MVPGHNVLIIKPQLCGKYFENEDKLISVITQTALLVIKKGY